MPFMIQVGPPQISIHQGQTVLISDEDGQIGSPSDKGLYFLDTRVISSWSIYANGEPWDLLNGGAVTHHTALVFLANRAFQSEGGPIPSRTLGLTVSRTISGGLHEDLDIANNGMTPVGFNLEVAMRSDFADVFEVKARDIVRRGRIITEWSIETQELRTTYRIRDFERTVLVKADRAECVYANGRLSFEVELEPGQSWHCCLLYELADGTRRFAAPIECVYAHARSQHMRELAEWQNTVLKIRTSNEEFYRSYHQATADMAALRFPMPGTDHMVFLPAAGLPWFVAPFGRDSLIVSIQNMLVYPEFARGALEVLGSLQATERDDYRDAEPGKILHEIRHGELAHFKLIPHTPYYGTADATPLYLVCLHAAWRTTGDRTLLERHLETAERALAWIDEWGDRDGDGFQEYQTRSKAGYENMGWKDSGNAVVNADGSPVKGPKALCELQGYVYDAWLRMAHIFDELGRHDRATALRGKAQTLFERFNEAFWDEELGFYAYALDGDKNKVLSVASNAGHCLWSGIVPSHRAARVVERLMRQDMWSGWGIRTLSARHRAFNPYDYQMGSVWPHDNGIIALGFKRYGFGDEACRIARDISGAASHFQSYQLPELYAGLQKEEASFPVQYLGANVPQAWAAGSVFMLLQAILGILPDGTRNRIFAEPTLPAWLPDITLMDLRVGKQVFDIRFRREEDGSTQYEVLKGDPAAVILRTLGEASQMLKTGNLA
jgi:glycogen debranching enzyme